MLSFDEKYSQAQKLVHAYLTAHQELIALGVIRTNKGVLGDYAEWLVANILKLELAKSGVQKGYDAVDQHGRTYQIKARTTTGRNTSFDFKNIAFPFDFLVIVLFSPAYELVDIRIVPYEVVKEMGVQNQARFSFRWNSVNSHDPRVKKIEWDK